MTKSAIRYGPIAVLGIFAAVLLVACSETPSAPQAGQIGPKLNTGQKPHLEMREGNEYTVTVNSVIDLFDKHGRPAKRLTHKADVRAKVVDGQLVAQKSRGTLRNASRLGVEDEVPDSINLMPVLAIATGDYASSYDNTQTDSVGNTTTIVGSTSTSGTPVSVVNTYRNDTLVVKTSMVWQSISGGYAMSSQIMKSYSPEGSIIAIAWSTPEMSTYTIAQNRSVAYRMMKSAEGALDRAFCLIAPKAAYASPTGFVHRAASFRCGWSISMFAASTFTMAVGTAILVPEWPALITPGAAAAYLVGWATWADSLHSMLRCLK